MPETSPVSHDAASIYAFLQGYRQGRPSSSGTGDMDPSEVPRSRHYAPSLQMTDLGCPQSPGSPAYLPSPGSDETYSTADLEKFGQDSQYSVSTAPSRWGPEPLHRQRPMVPLFEAPSVGETASELSDAWLPCEFSWFSDCQERFELDQEGAWVQHVLTQHLHRLLPKYCICWFCNEAVFEASSDEPEDKETNYRCRIRHITHHFREGRTQREIRPDHFLLQHIHANGLISEDRFEFAIKFHEAPQPRNGINAVPIVSNRPRDVAVEIRSRRRGRPESQRSYWN